MQRLLLCLALLLPACTGQIGSPTSVGGDDDDGDDDDTVTPPGTPDAAPMVDECVAAGIDENGACTGAAEISRCVDGHVQVEPCAAGSTCFELGAGPSCVSASVCDDVGPQGRCTDDTLYRCDGALAITDCAAAGKLCAFAAGDYACVAPADTGAARVRGTVTREKRLITPDGLSGSDMRPVRGATVALVRDADSSVLATAITSDDGTYTLRHDAAAGENLHLSLAAGNDAPVRPISVLRNNGNLNGTAGEPFAAAPEATADLAIPASAASAESFNVFDGAVRGFDYCRTQLDVGTLRPLDVYFQSGSGTGSYYDGSLNIAGQASNSDGWDDMVILHEFGHYTQDAYGISDNPGGAHDGSPASPLLAWGEGQATYFALVVNGMSYYADSNPGGGWHVELEQTVHNATAGGTMSQNISEWMVAELMFDVGDASADADADPLQDGDHVRVLGVIRQYMITAQNQDRGKAGADLVDWIDGWFMTYGLSSCSAMQSLMQKYGFPYDFSGPGGNCP